MITIHFSALFSFLLFLITCKSVKINSSSISKYPVIFLFLLAFTVRLIIAVTFRGFSVDIDCFTAWADRMFIYGPSSFYTDKLFCDYPPGYLYILYPLGFLRNLFTLAPDSGLSYLIIKLPAILCDIGTGYLLYRFVKKEKNSVIALFISALYLFQPAILVNSAFWGQVDSVFTFFLTFMCLSLMKGKMLPSYLAFGIGILLKPQMLVFTPILLCGIFEQVIFKNLTIKSFFQNLLQGCTVILGMVLLCLPFGISNCIKQYANTLGSYPYASVNAYNFWSLLGLNWKSQDTVFAFLSCKTWGTFCILFIVVFVLFFAVKSKLGVSKYPLLGAFIILNLFVFSVRMHERYMYPGLILLLLSYTCIKKESLLIAFQGFAMIHLYNTMHVLFYYDPTHYDWNSSTRMLISFGAVVCALFFDFVIVSFLFRLNQNNNTMDILQSESRSENYTVSRNSDIPKNHTDEKLLSRLDIILMLGITLFYSVFALYDLGERNVPETVYSWQQDNDILLDFSDQMPTTLSYYLAPWPDVKLTYTWIPKNVAPSDFQTLTKESLTLDAPVYTWSDVSIAPKTDMSEGYLLLHLEQSKAKPIEFIFTNANGKNIIPKNAAEYPALFDENHLLPARFSFRNSMYFDEIYHARTAKEYLNRGYSYENTHPPFGKIIISWGIYLFGMNPFGWRIMGTLFGIAMLPLIYMFGKRLTHSTLLAASACFIFAFDFMHFTQTRIATIDVFVTFFIIAMYYFMFAYLQNLSSSKSEQKKLIPLALSGICMGFGVASKWTAVYAGIGLALIFFTALILQYRKCEISARAAFYRNIKSLFLFCIVCFVMIPGIIYILSYIPFRDGSNQTLLFRMIHNQKTMLSYHSTLNATHPFSSPFYTWPLMIRPIWYYSGFIGGNLREGISAFGNPLVWWIGIPVFLYLLVHTIRKKDLVSGFLIIGYLAQYLPWMLVSRLTFIYHYFPSVPFVVLMIIYSLSLWKNKLPRKLFCGIVIAYTLTVFALFLLYYPVLSGQPIDGVFVKEHLRLMSGWILVSI